MDAHILRITQSIIRNIERNINLTANIRYFCIFFIIWNWVNKRKLENFLFLSRLSIYESRKNQSISSHVENYLKLFNKYLIIGHILHVVLQDGSILLLSLFYIFYVFSKYYFLRISRSVFSPIVQRNQLCSRSNRPRIWISDSGRYAMSE